MNKKFYVDVLTAQAAENKRPMEMALSDFMDFLIGMFDVKAFSGDANGYVAHIQEYIAKSKRYVGLAMQWMDDIANAMDNGDWLDAFGELYEEMYLTRGKASSHGQFFTPPDLSDMMTQLIATGQTSGKVNDCACGSGRLLVAHYMEKSKIDHSAGRRFEYVAQDVDPIACKMCALNMMAHGMYGTVICQNTLTLDTPSVVYHINEVRYPIPSPYYSIRVTNPKDE